MGCLKLQYYPQMQALRTRERERSREAKSAQWFLSPDSKAEKYYSISPYSYCGGNPIMFVDPDGREKLIYHFMPTKNEFHATLYPNDKAIHVFVHSNDKYLSLQGFNKLNKAYARSGADLAKVLSYDSPKWKNRKEGEQLTIVIHGCNVAKGKNSLAKKISASPEFKDHIIIAPNKKSILGNTEDGKFLYIGVYGMKDVNGEEVVDEEDMGSWVVHQNGQIIDKIPGNQMPTKGEQEEEEEDNPENTWEDVWKKYYEWRRWLLQNQ